MKIFFLTSFITLFFASLCTAQKKEPFTYPDNITDTAKKRFEKEFSQGQVFYKISCAKCHNKKVNGKEVIPDFSLPQLMDYEMRMYPQHEDKLDDKHVRDDEMTKIVLFLRYKKKSGVYITPPPIDPGTSANGGSQ